MRSALTYEVKNQEAQQLDHFSSHHNVTACVDTGRGNLMISLSLRLTAIMLLLNLVGCDIFFGRQGSDVSDNLNELQQIVKVHIPAKTIKWEIFGTPEQTGLAAGGRTDFLTLVAQAEGVESTWCRSLEKNAGIVWIAPESRREWLSPYFKGLLNSSNADMSKRDDCRPYQATVTKSGRLVSGFVCQHEGSLLIHMKLMSPSEY